MPAQESRSTITRSLDARRARHAAVLLVAGRPGLRGSAGCGYSIRAPFDKSVRTVFVPIFKTQSFRRDVNLRT